MPDKVDPDLVKELLQHHYMQHLLREEIRRQNKDYWNAKRVAVVGLFSTVLAVAAFFGFQLKDIFNLREKLDQVQKKMDEVDGLAKQLRRDAASASGDAQKASALAKTVEGSVESIQTATQRSLQDSAEMFRSSVENGTKIVAAAEEHMKRNSSAGDRYVDASRAMLQPIIKTAEDMAKQAERIGQVAQDATEASRKATTASDRAEAALKQSEAYEKAVKQIADLQKQLAKAWTSEIVTVLARDKDGTRMNSQPTVRMKYPEEPYPEYEFTFEMDSPGNSVSIRATVKGNGKTERFCHEEKRSGQIHGKYFRLGSSPFFMRPDFVYQSLLADDYVTLRVLATAPEGVTPFPMGGCRESWPK